MRHTRHAFVVLGALALLSSGMGCGKAAPGAHATVIKVAYWGGPEEIAIIQNLMADWQQQQMKLNAESQFMTIDEIRAKD